jgi:hypothetical protein
MVVVCLGVAAGVFEELRQLLVHYVQISYAAQQQVVMGCGLSGTSQRHCTKHQYVCCVALLWLAAIVDVGCYAARRNNAYDSA